MWIRQRNVSTLHTHNMCVINLTDTNTTARHFIPAWAVWKWHWRLGAWISSMFFLESNASYASIHALQCVLFRSPEQWLLPLIPQHIITNGYCMEFASLFSMQYFFFFWIKYVLGKDYGNMLPCDKKLQQLNGITIDVLLFWNAEKKVIHSTANEIRYQIAERHFFLSRLVLIVFVCF